MSTLPASKSAVRSKLVQRAPNYCLVMEFDNSVPPQSLHLDLEQIHSFSVSLRGAGDDWLLGLTEYRGDFTAIARFDNRDDAEDAFIEFQDALMRRRTCQGHGGGWWRWLLALIVIAGLLFAGTSLLSGEGQQGIVGTATPSVASKPVAKAGPAVLQEGVPMAADDLLQGR